MAETDEEILENQTDTPNLKATLDAAVAQKINANSAAAAYAQAAKEASATIEEVSPEDVTVQSETEALKAELADSERALKRLRADFENFRRRANKEKEEVGQVVKEEMLRAMLPLIDNFERAMATEDKTSESFIQGVEMICSQFGEVLTSFGLSAIEAGGEMFNPEFHQAVGRVPSETLPEGAVAAVLQKGYQVGGKVLRPSMVQVVGN